jgi:uncharacterized protein YegL
MTATDFTYLGIVADRSGSMLKIREDAEGGLKTLIKDQRELPGRLTVNLFQFDDKFDEVPVDEIDAWTLTPRGMTAMLDAIGKSMTIVGERLTKMPEDERPDKVIFAIVTDGLENASQEWRHDQVAKLVAQQQVDYGWQVVFTAANMDAAAVGIGLGVRRGSTQNFVPDPQNVGVAYANISAGISNFRMGATENVSVPENA